MTDNNNLLITTGLILVLNYKNNNMSYKKRKNADYLVFFCNFVAKLINCQRKYE